MRNARVTSLAKLSHVEAPLAVAAHSASPKRLARIRKNWFLVGTAFGAIVACAANFLVIHLVIPALAARPPEAQTLTRNAPTAPSIQTASAQEIRTPPPAPPTVPALSYPRKLALKIGRGDNLLSILLANHVHDADAKKVMAALKSKVNPSQLTVGQKISLTLARHETVGDKAAVRDLAIRLPSLDKIELQRLENGDFNVAAIKPPITEKTYRGFGKVRSSLFQAGADGGIPATAMREIVRAFSYDVDFQREIHPGDTIEVLIDRAKGKDGKYSGVGTIRYAALTLQGKKQEIFRFKNGMGELAWFDGAGNSIKKSLLRTPLDAAHITSGFGLRTHPILGYSKMHKGVDFGATTGTPIMAAGDGVVDFKGWKGGYGNFVVIRHNAKYQTAYGHISRFGNISVGNRVRQGQVIAYVGMTGAATGPHLHYEVVENDTQVNPVAKQFNMNNSLTGKTLAAFKAGKTQALKELAGLAKGEKVASR